MFTGHILNQALPFICFFLIKPIIKNISYGIDLQGGFEILYNIEPLEEGRESTANVVWADEDIDLSIIKIRANG